MTPLAIVTASTLPHRAPGSGLVVVHAPRVPSALMRAERTVLTQVVPVLPPTTYR